MSNENLSQVTVHALIGIQRRRLGVVSGRQDRTFTLPLARTVDLQLEFEVFASFECLTSVVTARPGDVWILRVPNSAARSAGCRNALRRGGSD